MDDLKIINLKIKNLDDRFYKQYDRRRNEIEDYYFDDSIDMERLIFPNLKKYYDTRKKLKENNAWNW